MSSPNAEPTIRFPLVSLGRLVRFGNGSDYKDVEVSDGGYPVYGSGGVFRRASRYLYEGESVLFGRKGTIDRPLYVSGRFWTVDTMYYTVPSTRIVPKFLYYAATTIPFEYYATNTAVPSMTQADLAGHRIPLPQLDEQRAIANYLDRETAQIDALVAKQEEFIELLRERRAGLIAVAVTGRNIGDERHDEASWLGSPPAGWKLGQVRHFGTVTLGKMLQSIQKDDDLSAPYMRAANVQPDGILSLDDVKSMWFSPRELRALELRAGDVVVVEGGIGGYGRAAFVADTLEGWGFQNSINRIRPHHENDGRYLTYFLIMARQKGFITAYCNIVSMPHLTAEKLEALPIFLPPPDEQRKIADRLDEQTTRIDVLIAKAEEHIALAKERRSALITAAVTGQFDVRTARKGARV